MYLALGCVGRLTGKLDRYRPAMAILAVVGVLCTDVETVDGMNFFNFDGWKIDFSHRRLRTFYWIFL